ncbi:resuscitation-promoting factor [Oerskovia turbata]|uniref:Resuscitation-promoting factor n=1 Tax=Oerskovia turbata TaxID=1713 RepID=A0A4Q1KXJ0_9CELL|nr:resuscitation-promoting factor [Oerskovia turbata]RXR26862.1 resuscitation-promoting factor [Oerskovia turbata]RXR34595.1 resuscitation-promoting factor [Oerskovia turbata]TGJ97868.1 resuscitation-promoting factor [Actinotalea fermentans ATCC 43279 = JCM 9966 = DSM 3133]
MRRRRWPLVAGATAVALVATGAVAYGSAKKTVELDVDGEITTVSTFAGSVEGLLAEEGIRVTDKDLIAPAGDSALTNGADVVVRYGRQVTVQTDGQQSDVWVTALDADEALDTLAGRGADVRLVASRSGADGRAALPLRLDADGPVSVVADGETKTAPDGSIGVNSILDQQGVVLGEQDRVSVARDEAADPAISLVVQRVAVSDVPTVTPIPFETVTEQDANRFADLDPVVKQEGVEGASTKIETVTTVDGVEESRVLVSDGVTAEPVAKIVVQGTKERPQAAPAPQPATSAPKARSQAAAPAAPSTVGGDVWAALAKCESGGNPTTNTGNGYYGLYQFSASTWRAVGGSGLPSQASAEEQTMRAQMLQARSGWGQWPACSKKLGLR